MKHVEPASVKRQSSTTWRAGIIAGVAARVDGSNEQWKADGWGSVAEPKTCKEVHDAYQPSRLGIHHIRSG